MYRGSVIRPLVFGFVLSSFLMFSVDLLPLFADGAMQLVGDASGGSPGSGGGFDKDSSVFRLAGFVTKGAALLVLVASVFNALKAFLTDPGESDYARERRREARRAARVERKRAAADAQLAAESSGSLKVLLAAARKKDAAAVELWLKFENDLSLLLSVPELVRVDGSLRVDSLKALESLMAAREGVVSGGVSEAEYLRVAEDSLRVIEGCVSEAEKLRDSAFSSGERSSLRVARDVVGSGSSGEDEIVAALSGLGFLELPSGAVSGVLGDRMLGARVVKRLEAGSVQRALPAA